MREREEGMEGFGKVEEDVQAVLVVGQGVCAVCVLGGGRSVVCALKSWQCKTQNAVFRSCLLLSRTV